MLHSVYLTRREGWGRSRNPGVVGVGWLVWGGWGVHPGFSPFQGGKGRDGATALAPGRNRGGAAVALPRRRRGCSTAEVALHGRPRSRPSSPLPLSSALSSAPSSVCSGWLACLLACC